MNHHQVIEAINKLYDPHSNGNIRLEASKWLEKFQNTIEAWNISVDLYLTSSSSSINVKLFAIQTIKHKIILDYAQLDENAAVSLKNTLLHELSFSNSNSNVISTSLPVIPSVISVQLNLALAALAVQMNEALWPDPIGDAIALKAMEMLTYIPEQLVNSSIPMTKEWFNYQRERLLNLKRIQPIGSLACILSWVKYSTNIDMVDLGLLWEYGFQELKNNPELASELLDELANMEEKIDSPSWFFQFLFPYLESNAELLKKAIKEEDENLVSKLGLLYLDIGEAYIDHILTNPSALQLFVQMAIEISEMPTLTSSGDTSSSLSYMIENTFNFWYELQKRIINNTESFTPIFTRLFMSLVNNHLFLPKTDNLEELDARREFRHVIGDVLKDCVSIIGSTEALFLLCERIEVLGFQEFILFAIRTISSVIDRRESEALPHLFSILLQSRIDDRRSIVLIIGCYAEWLRYHSEFLHPSFSYILESIENQTDSLSCVTALKYLSQSCAPLLRKEHLNIILSIRNVVDKRSSFEVIEALGAICLEHAELFDQVIEEIVKPSLQAHSPLIDQKVTMMDQIGILIESISGEKQIPTKIIMSFLSTVWPCIQNRRIIPLSDENIRKSLCLLYRSISKCFSEYLPFEILQEIIHCLVEIFKNWQIPMALIALENIIPWHERIPQIASLFHSLRTITVTNREAYLAWIYLNTCITRFIEPSFVGEGSDTGNLILESCLSSHVEEECRAAIYHLHYTDRLSPKHLEIIYQGITSQYPFGLMYDISTLLKQHYKNHSHNRELIIEATNQLLNALPSQLFLMREKRIWQENFIKAMDSPRSKELKEWLIQFSEACKRRLKQIE